MIGTHKLVHSPRAAVRLRHAVDWIVERDAAARVLILSPTLNAGSRALRMAVDGRPAAFGWERLTLRDLAARMALEGLAARGRVPVTEMALIALTARVVHRLDEDGALGRFAAVKDRPGLPRALTRSFVELSHARVKPERLEPDLARIYRAYRAQLDEAGAADAADVLALAAERAADPRPHPLLDVPLILLDVAVDDALAESLLASLARRTEVRAVVPSGDETARRRLERALAVDARAIDDHETHALARLARRVFQPGAADRASSEASPEDDASVTLFSAPGESRECVEIARRILSAVDEGVPFDRMAVLTHAPLRYRAPLAEAFRRAGIPAHFSRGTVRPDPAGRALLALLACAAEGLSARAFAEYLSLSVVPDLDDDGAPAPADALPWLAPEGAREVDVDPPAEEPWPPPIDPDAPAIAGHLRAPWRWERLLTESAVIGGKDRWRRRLDGLRRLAETQLARADLEEHQRAGWERRARDLEHLSQFALPLIDELAALPASGTWGVFLEHLTRLTERAIRDPARVLAVLRELAPMASVGPVGVTEVRLVLTPRLTEMVSRPAGSGAGKLFVGSTDEARGLSFERVFVPGLAERGFPRKVAEDPIVLDDARRALSPELTTTESRVERERLALRLAIGAARARITFSYPRLDPEMGRPRVPSFYALEIVRAVEGALPTLRALTDRADRQSGASMAWPAPTRPEDAIDGAEYDLAVLRELLDRPDERPGAANYLVHTNPHLARSLRARFTRWNERWWPTDGLVSPRDATRELLAAHAPRARPYSATALQRFAACPYRFYLSAIVKLAPREGAVAIESLDPVTRGTLIHEAQSTLLSKLREASLLPVTDARLEAAERLADDVMRDVATRYREELAPSIERVFADAIAVIHADLRAWLRQMSERPDWVPTAFELAFGLPAAPGQDTASVREPVTVGAAIQLRGAIDMVEQRDGALRATDFKTGSAPDRVGLIDGGRTLQPALYAMALEQLYPERRVLGGRLDYCTTRGRFESRAVPLSDETRRAVGVLAEVVTSSIDSGFLPAAPARSECDRCDYRPVCGPAEPRRVARKRRKLLEPLNRLRKQP